MSEASHPPSALHDPFGRRVSYLRVSVTDRCNFRCGYCMAEEMDFLPKRDLLTLEELQRVAEVFIGLGVNRLRITGGEPLVRRGILSLFRGLRPQLEAGRLGELTVTTNGTLLGRHAQALYDCGVRRINVSLDTLDADRFRELTRLGELKQVLDGLQAAVDAGLKVKINAVALRGINDAELSRMVAWCGLRGFDLALIEAMPLGEIGPCRAEHFMSLDEARAVLGADWTLRPSGHRTGGPARYFDVAETGSRVGFIAPYSHNFCESCNRVRLTCTGMLYLCLGQDDCLDLRRPLRDGASDAELAALIRAAIARKPRGHDFDESRLADGAQVVRFMSTTGG
jgi:cyclic pyranopterin phosphate synthase